LTYFIVIFLQFAAAAPAPVFYSSPAAAVPIVKTAAVPAAVVHTHSYTAPVVKTIPAPVLLNSGPIVKTIGTGPVLTAAPAPYILNAAPAPTIVKSHSVLV